MQWVGWAANGVLVATMVSQAWRQWHERSVEGVSPWLFIGQLLTSLLFLVYSVSTGEAIFIVSNAFLIVVSLWGAWTRHRFAGARQAH